MKLSFGSKHADQKRGKGAFGKSAANRAASEAPRRMKRKQLRRIISRKARL